MSTARQLEFIKFLRNVGEPSGLQAIIATHSPLLKAYPGARLLRIVRDRLEPIRLEETDHFNMLREFCADSETFVAQALAD